LRIYGIMGFMKKKTCIIIPIYNAIPTMSEKKSLTRNIPILKEYDILAVCPESMDLTEYEGYGFTAFLKFSDKYFVSNKSYSRLLLSEELYEELTEYDYMLIAQTDTYILNTEYTLEQFVEMGYDYYGAPWPEGPFDLPYGPREYFKSLFVSNPKKLRVGNGGFSLRNVKACSKAVKKHRLYIKYLWRLNEDLFFCTRLEKIAPLDVASKFALETNMKEELEKGNIPYALHAYEKYLNKIEMEKYLDF